MLPSELFAPAPRHSSHWVTVVVAVIAAVAAFVTLSFFIDALHLSMARGEALRLSRGMDVPAATSSTDQNPPAAPAQLQMARR